MSALERILQNMSESRPYAERCTYDECLEWMSGNSFPDHIQRAARWVKADRANPDASRWLMKRLMAAIRLSYTTKLRYAGFVDRHELRGCFRAVAREYLKQRAAVASLKPHIDADKDAREAARAASKALAEATARLGTRVTLGDAK